MKTLKFVALQCDCDTKEQKLHTIIVHWVMLTKQNENENKIKYLLSVYIALNWITVATSNLVVFQCSVFSFEFLVVKHKSQTESENPEQWKLSTRKHIDGWGQTSLCILNFKTTSERKVEERNNRKKQSHCTHRTGQETQN